MDPISIRIATFSFKNVLFLLACAPAMAQPVLAWAQNDLPALKKGQLERALDRSQPDHRVVLESVDGASSFIVQASGRIEVVEGQLLGFDVFRPEGLSIEDRLVSGQLSEGAIGFRVFGPIRELVLGQPSRIRAYVDLPQAAGKRATNGETPQAGKVRRMDPQLQSPTAVPVTLDAEASPSAKWRFVPDGHIEVTRRAGAGNVQNTQRLEFEQAALGGVAMWEEGDRPCGLAVYPVNDSDDTEIPFITCDYSDLAQSGAGLVIRRGKEFVRRMFTDGLGGSRRSAELPDHHAVVAVEVCLNNTGGNARVKGIELRGWRPSEYLDSDLDRAALMARDSFSRPNCRNRDFVSCPRQTIATGVIATLRIRGEKRGWVNGLRLICRPIETR